jgi:hypothetical protein
MDTVPQHSQDRLQVLRGGHPTRRQAAGPPAGRGIPRALSRRGRSALGVLLLLGALTLTAGWVTILHDGSQPMPSGPATPQSQGGRVGPSVGP